MRDTNTSFKRDDVKNIDPPNTQHRKPKEAEEEERPRKMHTKKDTTAIKTKGSKPSTTRVAPPESRYIRTRILGKCKTRLQGSVSHKTELSGTTRSRSRPDTTQIPDRKQQRDMTYNCTSNTNLDQSLNIETRTVANKLGAT